MLFPFGAVPVHWLWVALVIIFSLIEIFTMGLTTVWFAIAALVMVFVSFTGLSLQYQMIIFIVIAALLLIFTRPLAVKKLKMGKEKTNVDSLVGKHALVVQKIGEFEKGQVKVNGLMWSACSENNEEIACGIKCEITRVEGVRLIVKPLQEERI